MKRTKITLAFGLLIINLFTLGCASQYLKSPNYTQTIHQTTLSSTPEKTEVHQPTRQTTTVLIPTVTVTPSATTFIRTSTPTVPNPTSTPTVPTLTPSPSSTPTQTNSPTITPTFAILRGRVIPDRANCRYGPGWPYLYKYGLVGSSNLEVIGRIDRGDWVLVQAIGGDNPCWVKAELMDINGDVIAVQPVPVDIIQAWSPYYAPVTGVSAARNGKVVTISWHPLQLRPGDDSEQVPYVVEAWICQDGQIVFTPVGVYVAFTEVTDESGCDEPSWGQVLAAEKHGYTRPVTVPWPVAAP